ncbi:MAG: hypothetical protein JNK14_05705 [Chitinophagaceae bacterium]|nr:hypothetical protein [Chitinophagaceae bacterium]
MDFLLPGEKPPKRLREKVREYVKTAQVGSVIEMEYWSGVRFAAAIRVHIRHFMLVFDIQTKKSGNMLKIWRIE